MRHVMVVANETLVGTPLTKRIHELNESEPLDVHIVVPASPAADGTGIDRALANLHDGLEACRRLGVQASGRVGQADPMAAIQFALDEHPSINLILVSTLPLGRSRWVAMDLPHRIKRRFDLAVEHVIGASLDTEVGGGQSRRPIKVLLIDDDANDIELAKMALESLPFEMDILSSRTGKDAVDYMREASPKPDLTLVDIKMPGMDGFAMLEELTTDLGIDTLQELNVVMVSSSPAESDRERAHALGARAYVVKQPDFDEFTAVLGSIVAEVAHDRGD